jgi:hypothetical protein
MFITVYLLSSQMKLIIDIFSCCFHTSLTSKFVLRQRGDVSLYHTALKCDRYTLYVFLQVGSPDDRRKVWEIMSNICGKHSCFLYIKPDICTSNGRDAFMLLFDHFLGPNNLGNMSSADDTKLTGTLYNYKKKRFTWETYV